MSSSFHTMTDCNFFPFNKSFKSETYNIKYNWRKMQSLQIKAPNQERSQTKKIVSANQKQAANFEKNTLTS